MSNKYYVEVVAADGLSHHVGPFETRSHAREWIEQHTGGWNGVSGTYPVTENLAGLRQFRADAQLY